MSKKSLDYSILCPNYYTNWEDGCCMENCTHNDLDLCPIHYVKGLLEDKDQRIAELEEKLSNAIIPKFKIGQEVWCIDRISEKIYLGTVIGFEANKFKFNQLDTYYTIEYKDGCIIQCDFEDEFVFATEEEAQAKLEELRNG